VKVEVHYLAQVRQAAGRAVEPVELSGPCTTAELIVRLAQRGESLRRLLLDDRGAPQTALLLFVADEQVSVGPDVTLRDGDVVTVLAPMAGG
jgi:molybdopterin converting factor small subunit